MFAFVCVFFQVLAFLVFVLAVILNYGINGWVAFTASFVILEEVIAVIVRFINPGLIWQRPVIPLIFVSHSESVTLHWAIQLINRVVMYSCTGRSQCREDVVVLYNLIPFCLVHMQSIIYYIVALVMLFPGFVVAAVFSTVHTGIGAVAVSCWSICRQTVGAVSVMHRKCTLHKVVSKSAVACKFLPWLALHNAPITRVPQAHDAGKSISCMHLSCAA